MQGEIEERKDKHGGLYRMRNGLNDMSVMYIVNNNPVGICDADNGNGSFPFGVGRWWLSRINIKDPNLRGRKVGTRMLGEMKAMLIQNPTFVDILVAPGGYSEEIEKQFNFYRKNGFENPPNVKDALVWKPVAECDCPCGRKAKPVKGSRIYPDRADLHHLRIFLCEACGRYVGSHPDGVPKGVPADNVTRMERIEAHKWFDKLWNPRDNIDPPFASRDDAYAWLAGQLGKPEAHIGEMDAEEARKVPQLVREFFG